MNQSTPKRKFAIIGAGLLVAATGVGAGDLATATFSGSQLGVAVLWAVVFGAFMKFVLNEGLARWQVATNSTLLHGCSTHLGTPFRIVFLVYLLAWSFFVGSALISACGVAAHALLPVFDSPVHGKIVFGILHSGLGILLLHIGGFKWFERIMQVCIGLMFVTVLFTALRIHPPVGEIVRGIAIPRIPRLEDGGLEWTLALMGGVGGTLTVLSYSYWLQEKRSQVTVKEIRIDLMVAYIVTALFGLAMVIIGSQVEIEGRGAGLIVTLADMLEAESGIYLRWMFLIGAWGAIFSSLLGVWESVPFIFADFVHYSQSSQSGQSPDELKRTRSYRLYQVALSVIPLAALFVSFREIQKLYSIIGAFFMPFLAFVLLYLNNRGSLVGNTFKNHPMTNVALVGVLLFFLWTAGRTIFSVFQ